MCLTIGVQLKPSAFSSHTCTARIKLCSKKCPHLIVPLLIKNRFFSRFSSLFFLSRLYYLPILHISCLALNWFHAFCTSLFSFRHDFILYVTTLLFLYNTNSSQATASQCAECMWQHIGAGGFK